MQRQTKAYFPLGNFVRATRKLVVEKIRREQETFLLFSVRANKLAKWKTGLNIITSLEQQKSMLRREN